MEEKIIIIGTGNVASCLGRAFIRAGVPVVQLCAFTPGHGEVLARELECKLCSSGSDLAPEGTVIISALKDGGGLPFWKKLQIGNRLMLHTAGSLPLSILHGLTERYGVFYPLQTLSKDREMDFSNVPLLIEGNSPETTQRIRSLAEKISGRVVEVSSVQRRKIHVAAVFANNFTNLMCHMAKELLEEEGLTFEFLRPLIDETTAKLHTLTPDKAQTGPAVRWDNNVISAHLAMLQSKPEFADIYNMLSNAIHKRKSAAAPDDK